MVAPRVRCSVMTISLTCNSYRYINVAPNGDGRWRVWGTENQTEYQEEVFDTFKEAMNFGVPDYARALFWHHYNLSIDD